MGGLIFFLNLFGNNFCLGGDKEKLLQTQVGKTFDNELCGDVRNLCIVLFSAIPLQYFCVYTCRTGSFVHSYSRYKSSLLVSLV